MSVQLLIIMTVPHSCRNVGNHRCVRSRCLSADSGIRYAFQGFMQISLLISILNIVKAGDYSLLAGFIHLGAGLACGLTGLAAGYAIGYVGDAVRIRISHSIRNLSDRILNIVRSGICPRIESLRFDGSYSNFRRSPGSIWVRV